MYFEITSKITDIQTIAVGSSIREIARLRKQFGAGRWRKLKGVATVRLRSGRIRKVELHYIRVLILENAILLPTVKCRLSLSDVYSKTT